jgi:hypothetical protein
MTTHCPDRLDPARGIKLSRAAYESRQKIINEKEESTKISEDLFDWGSKERTYHEGANEDGHSRNYQSRISRSQEITA